MVHFLLFSPVLLASTLRFMTAYVTPGLHTTQRGDNRQGQLQEKQGQSCRNGNESQGQRDDPRATTASGLNWRQVCFNLYSIMRLVSQRSSQWTKDREQGFLQRDGRPGYVHPIL